MEIIFYDDFDLENSQQKILSNTRVTKWRSFEETFYLFDYKNKDVKDLVWQMKFKDNKKVPRFFAKFLSQKIVEIIEELDEDFILIPIPIHKKRRVERGFNQCERLCEEIIKNSAGIIELRYEPKILIREKYTVKQSWSNKEERRENLDGIFKVPNNLKNKIKDRKIILIDDVVTTGSTIKEAHRTLKESCASIVISIVISH